MNVLVTGATGFVGSRLVAALRAMTDHDVTVLVRDADDYEPPDDGITVAEGDVLEEGSFEDALEGIDVAYYLIHTMGSGDEDLIAQDRRAARNFERAATDADVERIVYLSGLGNEDERLSEHLASRRLVESELQAGSAEVTVLRAAIIIGGESASFRIVRQLAKRLPVMVTPRWVHVDCQPIAIDDVIAYLLAVLERPETAGGTYEIGGPDVLTYGEMLRTTARIARGWEPVIVPVPVLTPTLSAYWVDLVTDVDSQVAHRLIEGMVNPVVVEDDRLRELVGVDPTSFEDAVRSALAEEITLDGDTLESGLPDEGRPLEE
jgi:uncharacterized protein YbjT (DUF2867 family)